jgi:hypothetical protein
MNKINGQYIFNNGTWDVRYKVEDGDEQHYEQVMLHPNHTRHAKENQMGWFIIRDCPNLKNSGTWEPMAIVVQSDNLEEAAEKIKGQELFKKLNDHAMSVLTEAGSIPDPDNTAVIKTLNFSDEAMLSNGLRFAFGIVSEKGSLTDEQFTKAKAGFIHVAKWIRDNWKEADKDFLTAHEATNE